jgi:hypothetical protein
LRPAHGKPLLVLPLLTILLWRVVVVALMAALVEMAVAVRVAFLLGQVYQ